MRGRLSRTATVLASLLLGEAAGAADLTIVAPSAPGSGWDHLARAVSSALVEPAGGPSSEVVNVPGANGLVGLADFGAKAGEGRLLVTGEAMLAASLASRTPVSLDRLTPIARLTAEYYALVVPAGAPFRAAAELAAAMRAEPGKVTLAGGPLGGVDHVAAILLARAVGIEPRQLNYVAFLASADALAATEDARVAAAALPVGDVRAEILAGRLRVLGVSAPYRLPVLDTPTLLESGIDLDFANWRGVMARPGLDREEKARLVALLGRAVGTAAWARPLAGRDWSTAFLPGDAFAAFLLREQLRVKDALKSVGMLRGGVRVEDR